MFFFKPSKAKQFNYKPIYLKDNVNIDQNESQEELSFSDKMHRQWNRIPTSKLLQNGKRKIFSIALMTFFAFYLVLKAFEYLNQLP